MNALEKRFGRPDAIAIAEIQNLRTLQRPTDSPNSICEFAGDFTNIISSLRKLKKYYLYNPEIIKCTLDKFTSAMKYRWFDFSAEQPQEEPDLIKMARFLEEKPSDAVRTPHPKPLRNQGDTITQMKRIQKTFLHRRIEERTQNRTDRRVRAPYVKNET
ncbi:hypothetical protein EVAR_50309_1 [Eumeta japonica]|uniref:Uncharacterized protein n=1 Tax=Eumeta variegata TaxID=151549 RepID=A0A4C2A3D2_EUMVA|nr:hypothetical protein EVAR_50309_1 [Eumeta japonica]